MTPRKIPKGQSLLEMVFAIGILLFVVSAVLALATANVLGQKESEFQIVANNLAREGIEVVRNMRDSNWLAGIDWLTGLDGGSSAAAVFDSVNNSWQLDFISSNYVVNVASNGIHGDPNLGQPSIYSRQIFIDDICQMNNGEELIGSPSCVGSQIKIGIKVTSRVTWEERGRRRELSIEDLLYEWK